MNRKLLTTTLLSMSLLSLNLSAGNCKNGYCMVDISNLAPKVKKMKVKKSKIYEIILLDNIETIVFSDERYVMTQDEIAEYEFEKMQKTLLIPSLNSDNMPMSDELCADDLKAVKIAGIANTYECAKI